MSEDHTGPFNDLSTLRAVVAERMTHDHNAMHVVDPELVERVRNVAEAVGKDRHWKAASLTGYDWRRIYQALSASPVLGEERRDILETALRGNLTAIMEWQLFSGGEYHNKAEYATAMRFKKRRDAALDAILSALSVQVRQDQRDE